MIKLKLKHWMLLIILIIGMIYSFDLIVVPLAIIIFITMERSQRKEEKHMESNYPEILKKYNVNLSILGGHSKAIKAFKQEQENPLNNNNNDYNYFLNECKKWTPFSLIYLTIMIIYIFMKFI